jgi:ABC-2 type transport system ATP-binding protein
VSDPPAVTCRDLRFAFGDTVAVDGVDLAVQPGEILGLLGPNGAGKTTTIRAITSLLPVPAGTIEVFGADVTRRPMAVRRAIGYVPQLLSADGTLTAAQNVALFARLYDVPRRQRRAAVAEVLDAMGLSDVADRPVQTFSGGMIRRLELAQALVSSPRLLILDEPTIGLDPVARVGVWERITDVRERTGMTVLVTTHYMAEAQQWCDRVALMHRGRIRALDSPAALIAQVGGDSLDDVFRAHTGDELADGGDDGNGRAGGIRSVRATRRTASRLG